MYNIFVCPVEGGRKTSFSVLFRSKYKQNKLNLHRVGQVETK